MALDYAAILDAGQHLVPDLRLQSMQDQQFASQQQQASDAHAMNAIQLQDAQEQLRQQQELRPALDQALLTGHPRDILNLMTRFPKMSAQLKPVYDALDKDQRQHDMTQMGTIYSRAQAGDFTGAAGVLQQRIAADKAAGQDTSVDEQILAGLQADDPVQRNAAMGTVGMSLAAADPEHFADIYGKLNPQDKLSPTMREYEDRAARFGKAAADQWLATQDTKLVPVQQGGTVYAYGPTAGTAPAQSGGGDQSTGAAGYSMPVAQGRFGAPDQQFGAARAGHVHNGLDIAAPAGSPVTPIAPGKVVAVGDQGPKSGGLFVKVKHADGTISSYAHLGSQAVAVGQEVGPGDSLGTVGTSGNATAPVVHLVIRKDGRAVDPRPLLTGARVVRTKQDYDRLPAGADYIAPDGTHRRKG